MCVVCLQVSMRACAREVGMSAIQSASVERSLEKHLAEERKALLAALHRPGAKGFRDIAAGGWGLLARNVMSRVALLLLLPWLLELGL